MAEATKDSIPESPEVADQVYRDVFASHVRQAARIFDVPLELLAPDVAQFDGFALAHQGQQ